MNRTSTRGLARTHTVETPEQVELGFEIADLGSRFVALLLDGLVLAAAMTGFGLLALWAAPQLGISPRLAGWAGAAAILISFLVLWGYFVYFEGYRNGRTPGKRWAGLRVVHEGGHPLTVRGAAIRNLVRVIDAQPVFTWMVGGVAMMLHPRTQRLGDMAAATLVVRDRGAEELGPEDLERLARNADERPELPEETFAALDRFVEGRRGLEKAARERLGAQLGEALGDHLEPRQADASLEDALVALRDRERDRRAASAASGPGGGRLAAALVRTQGASWAEYRALLDRAGRHGLRSLGPHRLERFASLYRMTASDLARARTYGASWPVIFSLERWVGEGHNLLYSASGRSWAALVGWLRHGFPSRVRARRGLVALAAAFLFLPGFAAYGALIARPELARDLLPHEMIARAETGAERAAGSGQYVEVPEVMMPIMSSGIIANNVQVTFMAFAAGILAGIGTAALLVMNGVFLGAVVALFQNEGAASLLWAFVAPHGVIELAAICIAGGAGLILGSGIIAPGRLTRAAALAERGREAISLLAGTTLLLILAGLVEGFISPAPIALPAKLTIAAALALAVLAYLLLAGRGEWAGASGVAGEGGTIHAPRAHP